jgi:hypothetical protein
MNTTVQSALSANTKVTVTNLANTLALSAFGFSHPIGDQQ